MSERWIDYLKIAFLSGIWMWLAIISTKLSRIYWLLKISGGMGDE